MYLKNLTQTEKNAFYFVASEILAVDGKIAEQETFLLNQFLDEMNLNINELKEQTFSEAIDILKTSAYSTKKQIYTELYALCLCDESFEMTEKHLINTIASELNISADESEKIQTVVNELIDIYERMNNLVNGEE